MPEIETTTESLVKEIHVEASPEDIWPFLTESAKFARWMGRDVHLDPRPHGEHRIEVSAKHVAGGEYLTIEPYSRVVFTFGWAGDDQLVPLGSSTVEITLTKHDDGTTVRLEHRGLPLGGATGHDEGWSHYLPRLATVACGGDPGIDPWSIDEDD